MAANTASPSAESAPQTSAPPPLVASEISGDSTQKPPGQSPDNAEMAANTANPSADLAPQTSVPPPLAASTTSWTPLDSSHKNTNVQRDNPDPNVQGDNSDSEPESNQVDDSTEPKTPKYKVGTFIIKEVDGIWCTGVIHRVIFEKKSFLVPLFCEME